jgi:NADH dehydrogenase/NADH:ubiquinone oxidoreductase subunit G
MMGACQDCWMWLDNGGRVRACTTPLIDGMAVRTRAPEGFPSHG